MQDIELPGHGAHKRPEHLKVKDRVFAGAPPTFDWSQVKEDSVGNVPHLFGINDRDQGSSSSCTCQTTGYGFAYKTGIEISREDLYANVALPGGGAYLNAPLDWLRNKGYRLLSKYPDPHPETESNMIHVLVAKDNRVRTFQLTYTYYTNISIDSAALAATNHDYIHLGIEGSWKSGWNGSWVDPLWQGVNDWQHALFACKTSIVLRHGVPAIKAKSSWCEHHDYQGNPVYCHYLTKNYFPACFEIIGVDIKELTSMNLVNDNGTYFLVGEKGKIGLADTEALVAIKAITDLEQAGSTAGVPQVKVLKKSLILE